MYIHIYRAGVGAESHNLVHLLPSKGMGESGIFLGSSVFFAIRDTVSAA